MENIIFLEKNLDYISVTAKFSTSGFLVLEKKLKEEVLSEIIRATTLKHNKWEQVFGRKTMFRSLSGLTLLAFSNRITMQVSGEAFVFLDEFDIKDLIIRFLLTIKKLKAFDLDDLIFEEPRLSLSRLDSQIMIAIKSDIVEDFFDPNLFKNKNGDLRVFYQNILDKQNLTGITYLKKKTYDYYSMNEDTLLSIKTPEVDKVDFLRIYDKTIEVLEKNDPNSEKRRIFLLKYGEYLKKGYRIFRVEIEERENRLTNHLNAVIDEKNDTFENISHKRFESFIKRNPFKFWQELTKLGLIKSEASTVEKTVGSYVKTL